MVNRFPSQPRTTINDVAALAGVSKATVSKVLSTGASYYVSQVTRRKIEDAIAELNYHPNALAQGLSTQRSSAIGVVVASIANPFYPTLVAGVEQVIEPAGYTLLLGSSGENEAKEAAVVKTMIERRVEGVIVASASMRDREVEKLIRAGIEVVVASRELADKPIADTVVIDNRQGGAVAARHLLEHGHREAVHLTGPLDVVAFRHRAEGFASVYPDGRGEVVTAATSELPDALAAARALLERSDRPTAVLAGSDTIALGIITAAAQLGLSIPEDLALIGFDNIWVAGIPGVSLTTVNSRARQVGRTAADMLTVRIAARRSPRRDAPAPPERLVIGADLVVRTSCGCSEVHDAEDQ